MILKKLILDKNKHSSISKSCSKLDYDFLCNNLINFYKKKKLIKLNNRKILNFNNKQILCHQRSKSAENSVSENNLNLLLNKNNLSSDLLVKKLAKPVPNGPLINHCYIPTNNSIYDKKKNLYKRKNNQNSSNTQYENINFDNNASNG